MKEYHHFATIAEAITFPGLEVIITENFASTGEYFLRVRAPAGSSFAVDNASGETGHEWTGRPWKLSKHMTDGEVVQTAWLAVQTALEHEARETFKYKGQTIFGPHFNIDDLVELAAKGEKHREAPPATA